MAVRGFKKPYISFLSIISITHLTDLRGLDFKSLRKGIANLHPAKNEKLEYGQDWPWKRIDRPSDCTIGCSRSHYPLRYLHPSCLKMERRLWMGLHLKVMSLLRQTSPSLAAVDGRTSGSTEGDVRLGDLVTLWGGVGMKLSSSFRLGPLATTSLEDPLLSVEDPASVSSITGIFIMRSA